MPPVSNRSPRMASRAAARSASIHHAGSCSRVPSSRSTISRGARPTATTSSLVWSRSTTFVDCVPQSMPRKTLRTLALPPGVHALRDGPGVLTAGRADDAAGEVIGLDVDPAEDARLPGLIGRVVVRRPRKNDVCAGPRVDAERTRLDRPLRKTAGEVLAAGDRRHDFRRGAAERAVAGDVAGERRGHKGLELIRR